LIGGIVLTIIDLYSNIFENFIDIWTLTAAVLLHFIMGNLTEKLKSGEIRYDQEDQVVFTIHECSVLQKSYMLKYKYMIVSTYIL